MENYGWPHSLAVLASHVFLALPPIVEMTRGRDPLGMSLCSLARPRCLCWLVAAAWGLWAAGLGAACCLVACCFWAGLLCALCPAGCVRLWCCVVAGCLAAGCGLLPLCCCAVCCLGVALLPLLGCCWLVGCLRLGCCSRIFLGHGRCKHLLWTSMSAETAICMHTWVCSLTVTIASLRIGCPNGCRMHVCASVVAVMATAWRPACL